MTSYKSILLLALFLAGSRGLAQEQWTADGAQLATATISFVHHQITSDGHGGFFMVWEDNPAGDSDIYAQWIDASGQKRWGTGGVVVTSASGDQRYPAVLADGLGGAFVAWQDAVSGDIAAQQIDASGALLGTANGIVICAATGEQSLVQMVSDGAGGIILAWEDRRAGSTTDLYAQRLSDQHQLLWNASGMPVCTAEQSQSFFKLRTDGAGGAYLVWQDGRSGNQDIYAQRIDASGNPLWTVDGLTVCAETGNQIEPDAVGVTDGIVFTWEDERDDPGDIYAQKLDGAGAAQWTAGGLAVSAADGSQTKARIAADAQDNIFIAWTDNRSFYDIYAQKLDGAGAAQWTADGLPVNTEANTQFYPELAADGLGGAWIVWNDNRTGTNANLYYQRVASNGALSLDAAGVSLSSAAGPQQKPLVLADSASGLLAVWSDSRDGQNDLYGQHLNQALSVETPTAGAVLGGGQTHNIAWTLDLAPTHQIASVALYLSVDDGATFDTEIVSDLDPDAGGYDWTVNAISASQARVQIRAVNDQGLVMSRFLSDRFAIDADPPTAFGLTSPADGGLTDLDPDFTWEATTDVVSEPVRYTLYIDDLLVAQDLEATAYTPTTPLSEGDHTWYVVARDQVGQIRQSTQTRTFSASADHDPPEAFALTSPADDSWTAQTTMTLAWEASSDAGSGISGYTVVVDGADAGQTGADVTQFDLSGLTAGDHTWRIDAADGVGNLRASETQTFHVDPNAPAAFNLLTPATGTWTDQGRPTLTWEASTDAGIGLSHYRVLMDGSVIADPIASTVTSYTLTEGQALAEGDHPWRIEAVDLLGNVRASEAAFTIRVDQTPPGAFALSAPADNARLSTLTPTLSWEGATDATSGVSHYLLVLDGAVQGGPLAAGSITLGSLTEGAHTWAIQAVDEAGNVTQSGTRRFTADVTPPDPVILLEPASGATLNALRPRFTWRQGGDALSGFDHYEFYVDGQLKVPGLALTDTTLTLEEDLANGEHDWKVLAYDRAGNVRSSAHFPFTIAAYAPVITSATVVSATEDIPFSYTATATDANGDLVSLTFENGPDWCTVQGNTISGTPQNGATSTSFRVIARDQLFTVTQEVTLTLTAVNDAPTLSSIADQAVDEDGVLTGVSFTVGDEETPAADLVVTTQVSDTTLISPRSIVLSGTGPDRQLALSPKVNQSGSATITVTVSDGARQATTSFVCTIHAVNDRPWFTPLANQTTPEDIPLSGIGLAFGDIESAAASLTLDVEIGNTGLITQGGVVITRGDSPSLALSPLPNAFGQSTIGLRLSDGDRDTTITFTLTVNPVNDAPVVTSAREVQAIEDTPFTYAATAQDIDNDPLTLRFAQVPAWLTVSGTALAGAPPEGVDQAAFQVIATDGALSDTLDVTIAVTPVNDAPAFVSALPSPILTNVDSLRYTLNIDDYVADPDHADSLLTWSAHVLEPLPLTVSICGRPRIVSIQGGAFSGQIHIVFTVKDPLGASATDTLIIQGNTTAVEDDKPTLPKAYTLYANYPNPFNPATALRWAMPKAGTVRVIIYNLLGQEVEVLLDEPRSAGYHEVTWHPQNMPSGVYLFVVQSGDWRKVGRMVYTK